MDFFRNPKSLLRSKKANPYDCDHFLVFARRRILDPVFSLARYEFKQALGAYRKGLIQNCLKTVQRHLLNNESRDLRNLPFCLLSIKCHLNLGDFSRALLQAQQAVTHFPGQQKALYLLARAMEKYGRNLLPQALACYRKVVAANPNHIPSLKGIVRILCREQNLAEARSFQRQIVQHRPENPNQLIRLIRMARHLGDHGETGNLVRQGRFLFPKSDWFHRNYRTLGENRIQRTPNRKGPRVLHFLNIHTEKPTQNPEHDLPKVLRLHDSPRFQWTRAVQMRDRRTPG